MVCVPRFPTPAYTGLPPQSEDPESVKIESEDPVPMQIEIEFAAVPMNPESDLSDVFDEALLEFRKLFNQNNNSPPFNFGHISKGEKFEKKVQKALETHILGDFAFSVPTRNTEIDALCETPSGKKVSFEIKSCPLWEKHTDQLMRQTDFLAQYKTDLHIFIVRPQYYHFYKHFNEYARSDIEIRVVAFDDKTNRFSKIPPAAKSLFR